MTELHFLRHADAGDPEAWEGPDEPRPLSDKGEKQADRLGRFLAGVGFKPDAIITSPKLRAAQTAEIVAEHLGLPFAIDTGSRTTRPRGRWRRSRATRAIRRGRSSSVTTRTSASSWRRCRAPRRCR